MNIKTLKGAWYALRSEPTHFAVAELIREGDSKAIRFFTPTRFEWMSKLKIWAYTVWHRDGEIVSRIVSRERAEYLLVSYSEWVLRRQIDAAT